VLTRAEAAAALAEFADRDWVANAQERARALGTDEARVVADQIIESVGRLPSMAMPQRAAGQRFPTDADLAVIGELDQLSTPQQGAVLASVHPQLGSALLRWWPAAAAFEDGAAADPAQSARRRAFDLVALLGAVAPYPGDASWLAAWLGHLPEIELHRASESCAAVLVTVINSDQSIADEVAETLIATVERRHPIGVPHRAAFRALAMCSRREAWAALERLLTEAGREHGVRTSIYADLDVAAPPWRSVLLDRMLESKATAYADVRWDAARLVGLSGLAREGPFIDARLRTLRRFIGDDAARRDALHGADPVEFELAVRARMSDDASGAVEECVQALDHPDTAVREAAVGMLGTLGGPRAREHLLRLLGEPDLRLAALAFVRLGLSQADVPRLVDVITTFGERLRKEVKLVHHGPGWSPTVVVSRANVAKLLVERCAEADAERLLPLTGWMDATTRARYAFMLGKQQPLTPAARRALVDMAAGRSDPVRTTAIQALEGVPLNDDELVAVEAVLARTASGARRGVLELLAAQPPQTALRSARRLWASGELNQRDGACELLVELGSSAEAHALADEFRADAPSAQQRAYLDRLRPVGLDVASDPTLGLYEPARLRPPMVPRRRPMHHAGETAASTLHALDALIDEHRNSVVVVDGDDGPEEVLLADARRLPGPGGRGHWIGYPSTPAAPVALALGEVFRSWWADRPRELRAEPDLDALDALALLGRSVRVPSLDRMRDPEVGAWLDERIATLLPVAVPPLRHPSVVDHVLSWLLLEGATSATVEVCLDVVEDSLASLPDELAIVPSDRRHDNEALRPLHAWRWWLSSTVWSRLPGALVRLRPAVHTPAQTTRATAIDDWLARPEHGGSGRIELASLLTAYRTGDASEHDLIAQLLAHDGRDLKNATAYRRDRLATAAPGYLAAAERVRSRVLEIELARGAANTAASAHALRLGSVIGARIAVDLLARLGPKALVRGYIGDSAEQEGVYSHLLRVSAPADDDDGPGLAALAAQASLPRSRLLDLAMYAPQWARLVEAALGWPGLEDAVWWVHAHTKDDRWSVSHDIREIWAAAVRARTPISAGDLHEGAVDVGWFRRAHEALGPDRWSAVAKAIRLASGGNGHRRARLFADALLGHVDASQLLEKIAQSRHQDAVRALGLVPLPASEGAGLETAAARYRQIREFSAGSRSAGMQRRASEQSAVRIAVDNLARTAGFADPLHFIWTVEAAENADLAAGPVVVEHQDVTVSLIVGDDGSAELRADRGGKRLSSVPAALRKVPAIAELRERKTALAKQVGRVRASLEQAMVDGTVFDDEVLARLEGHPVVAPMLRHIVWVDEASVSMRRVGNGWSAVGPSETIRTGGLRIAHPVDLLGEGTLLEWQRAHFAESVKQPFRQLFRELYVPTAAERDRRSSRRYEAQRLDPRRALALFTARGWVVDRDAEEVFRPFHRSGVRASVRFADTWLMLLLDDPCVEAVEFTAAPGSMVMSEVPPIVFSEAMRDLDLVVSVAHASGTDQETSASTVEARAVLVRETAELLQLANVVVDGRHVLIDGRLGEYSVHLGSGVVHQRPGGAVCIVPVDAQRRGRVFLPFVEPDPKAAEIIAKVVLLAKDHQIKDPTILAQLRRR
jgi:hypothetical protein